MIFYISIQKILHIWYKQRRLTQDTTLANHFANEFWRLLACTNPFYAGGGMSAGCRCMCLRAGGGEVGWLSSYTVKNIQKLTAYLVISLHHLYRSFTFDQKPFDRIFVRLHCLVVSDWHRQSKEFFIKDLLLWTIQAHISLRRSYLPMTNLQRRWSS